MPDFSDTRPRKWWVLDPDAHHLKHCGRCGAALDTELNLPMLEEDPLCSICAADEIKGAPMTVEYLTWVEKGDPRWWSAWLCNCTYCHGEGLM